MKRVISALVALLLSAAAHAQTVPLQGGPWTPGHSPMYSVSGSSQPVIQDSGPAGGGGIGIGLSEFLQTSRPGNGVTTPPYANSGSGPLNTHGCFYDAPITNSTGFHFLCLDANAQGGGLITFGAGGGASPLPFLFNINGATYNPLTGTVINTAIPSNTVLCNPTGSPAVASACTTIPASTVPTPSASTLGGIQSYAAVTHQWINAISTSGVPSSSQPAFTDISGSATLAQLPSIPNSQLATMAANTIKGNNTASPAAPIDLTGAQAEQVLQFTQSGTGAVQRSVDFKLKDFVTAMDFGASGSTQTTTGTISSASASLALTSALDFANGQGIRVNRAGPTFSASPPTSPSAVPQGTPGGTTYTYTIASLDGQCGVGTAIANFSTTTGNAVLSGTNFNRLSWTAGAGFPQSYAIYGRALGSLTLIGIATGAVTFDDWGQTAPYTPDWLPSAPQGSSLNDCLVTSISSGGGTTSLTLANTANNNATTQTVAHDDNAAIQAAINSLTHGGTVYFPAGTYNQCSAIVMPSTVNVALIGSGRGNPASTAGTVLNATCPSYEGNIDSIVAFLYGSKISTMTLEGNTLRPYNLRIKQSDGWLFENLHLLDAGFLNFQLGDGTHNTLENRVIGTKIDNPLILQTGNLPFYNFESNGTNNNYEDLKASNARISNLHSSTTSANNTWVNVHGYDFFSGAAQAPANNWLIEGFGEQLTSWEADGSAGVNVQINGSGNILVGGFSQYGSLTAGKGVQFATGTSGNIVANSVFQNSSTANSIVQAGTAAGAGNFFIGNYNTSQGTVIGSRWTNTIVPTLTAGCNGAGSSVSSDASKYSGRIIGQTAAATTCTVTFGGGGFASTPRCTVSGETGAITSFTPSTTTLVTNFASTASFTWDYTCDGN